MAVNIIGYLALRGAIAILNRALYHHPKEVVLASVQCHFLSECNNVLLFLPGLAAKSTMCATPVTFVYHPSTSKFTERSLPAPWNTMAWTAPLESDNSTHLKANGTLQNVHSVKVKEGEVLIPSGEVVAKVRIFIAMRHSSARLLENSQGFEETLRDNNFRLEVPSFTSHCRVLGVLACSAVMRTGHSSNYLIPLII